MPLLIDNKKHSDLTDEDVRRLTNEAYDRGGADVLKLMADTCDAILKDRPDLQKEVVFTGSLVEGLRRSLREVVENVPPSVLSPLQ